MSFRRVIAAGLLLALSASAAESPAAHEPDADIAPLLVLPPVVGVRLGGSGPRFTLSLAWTIRFGPLDSAPFLAEPSRPFRAAFEVGVVSAPELEERRLYFRWGVRRVWQPLAILGIGVGAGVTQELSERASVTSYASPELTMSWGKCCAPGFLQWALRCDYSVETPPEWVTQLGITFW
jgi:hypothetical protein